MSRFGLLLIDDIEGRFFGGVEWIEIFAFAVGTPKGGISWKENCSKVSREWELNRC